MHPDRTRSTEVYLRWWLDEVLPGTVAEVAEAHYRRVLELWVIPHVGHVKLGDLRPTHVQAMMRALERQGLSPDTRRGARSTLGRALRWAEMSDPVARNAATLAPGPKGRVKVDDAVTADEVRQVLAQVEGDRLEALVVLALTLGLRQGELLALRWSDIEWTAGLLRVDQSKTLAGERSLPLVRGTLEALRQHKARQTAERPAAPIWVDTGLVFTGRQGQPLLARSLRWWWYGVTEAALGERRRFHTSRHRRRRCCWRTASRWRSCLRSWATPACRSPPTCTPGARELIRQHLGGASPSDFRSGWYCQTYNRKEHRQREACPRPHVTHRTRTAGVTVLSQSVSDPATILRVGAPDGIRGRRSRILCSLPQGGTTVGDPTPLCA